MEQVTVLDRTQPEVKAKRQGIPVGLITLLCVIILVSLAVYRERPPTAVSTAPASEFASGRAMQHLNGIASKPHPLGSAEHDAVRDYIVKELTALGLNPQVQKTTGINPTLANPVTAGTVENIVARLEGTANRRPVLLVSHYDSVPSGPGASDDGTGVATMLETARALKAGGTPLKNDVVFLFTDGEEAGLLGANAFAAEHPLTRGAGVMLNFEARGSGGPAYMFETSVGNQHLVEELAAAPYPATSSLMYEVYKLMPNDTDLTVFKRAKLEGMNFAFIGRSPNYHTQLDSVENVDERSLQHQGTYALALARRLGDAEPKPATGDAVYFSLLGSYLVHYPTAWVLPLAALTALSLLAVVWLGLKRKRLRLSGVVLGFVAMLASMIATWGVVSAVWWLVRATHDAYRSMPGDTYNSWLYLASFVALTAAVTASLLVLFRRWAAMQDLWAGALVFWLVLLVPTALLLPGASYLLTWPLLFSLLALGLTLFSDERTGAGRLPILFIGAVVGTILFVPVIHLMSVALTVNASGLAMVAVALLLGLFVPQLSLMTERRRWLMPVCMLLVSVGFIAAGAATAGFDQSRPRRDSIFYGLNAGTGGAVWASADAQTDAWTSQFIPSPARQSLADFFPLRAPEMLAAAAPAAQLDAPSVEVLSDEKRDGVRALRLKISSPRRAPVVSIGVEADAEVRGTTVNGKRIDVAQAAGANKWGLRYFALPAEGIELTLETKSAAPLALKVVDQSYGLPALSGFTYKERPGDLIPASVPFGDSTLVSRSFTF
ncbi:MAG TPA: M20/M25/M40 family metallo-hydrolase [Pyrinomonadaceae bacterium]